MKFTVLNSTSKNIERIPNSSRSECFLFSNTWNDYGYRTLFELFFINYKGEIFKIGPVRIGNNSESNGSTHLPNEFTKLDKSYFSLGAYEGYYESLNLIDSDERIEILKSLNDIAYNLNIFDSVEKYDITQKSLLRSITPTTVKGQLHRISLGGARLSNYDFDFIIPQSPNIVKQIELSFNVIPDSPIPTNIHVLIGRNGVGKTTLLLNMIRSLVNENQHNEDNGYFVFKSDDDSNDKSLFANVVSVAFSAFDKFDPIPEHNIKSDDFDKPFYTYVGLKKGIILEDNSIELKSPRELEDDFCKSIAKCLGDAKGKRKSRWLSAIKILEADPMFEEADLQSLQKFTKIESIKENALPIFKELSSGHKIILLTITKLVETVEERTLLLIDEPESHLHPPLLASFIRALSELLLDRNGVALIATHSPVVLQEVPTSCVWILDRTGKTSSAYRPNLETFGENTGILTSEVFTLEVTRSGFHRLLQGVAMDKQSYDLALAYFNNKLGGEAKAILRSLFSQKNKTA